MDKFLTIIIILALSLVGCAGKAFTGTGPLEEGQAGEAGSGFETGGSAGTAGLGQGGSAGSMAGSGGSIAGTGGSSAGNPSGGTGGTVTVVCDPGTAQCSNGTFEICNQEGTEKTSEVCEFVCTPDGCAGVCNPGETRCEGTVSQTCNAEGVWVSTTSCPFVCDAGMCVGECVPNTETCQDNATAWCSQEGVWEVQIPCEAVCNIVGEHAVCAGSCTPGTFQCEGLTPQTCVEDGTWENEEACPYICFEGACLGACVPGTVRCGSDGRVEACALNGSWEAAEEACPFACSEGVCTGICVPNQPCTDDGNECTNDVCSPDGQSCTHPAKGQGTACTSDGNVCTSDICNGSGSCTHVAAPAATVCRTSSCSDGQLTEAATCGGSTTCPALVISDCNGACADNGLTCEFPGVNKVDSAYTMLAIDNDASYVYASVRTQSGVSQIVRYTKDNNTKMVLYENPGSAIWIHSMIVAGSHIYLSEVVNGQGSVRQINTYQTNQSSVFVSSQATFGFAKNSTHVFWSDMPQTACACSNPSTVRIYQVAIGDTTPTTMPRTFSEISPDIEVDGSSLYVWQLQNFGGGQYNPYLVQYPLGNQSPGTTVVPNALVEGNSTTYLGATSSAMPGLTKNTSTIFANVNISGAAPGSIGSNNAIFKVQSGTAQVMSRTSPIGLTSTFAAGSSYLYIQNMRMSVAGGSLTYFIPHSIANNMLSVDGGSVYFGSYGYWNDEPYEGTPDVALAGIYRVSLN